MNVASRLVAQVGQQLGQPLALDATKFERAYDAPRAAVPDFAGPNASPKSRESRKNFPGGLGVDLELSPSRVYPSGSTAAHVLGYLRSDNDSQWKARTRISVTACPIIAA